ncbi:hypothetical protein IMZ48_20355 [Candidatus Bathyarchaeota archaeon]|nr:hypothetical protein [Candidatus Bathyarchaeota archaeon]
MAVNWGRYSLPADGVAGGAMLPDGVGGASEGESRGGASCPFEGVVCDAEREPSAGTGLLSWPGAIPPEPGISAMIAGCRANWRRV